MSPEVIAITAVGVSLAALILTERHRAITERHRAAAERAAIREDLRHLESDLGQRIARLESDLGQRLARLEGAFAYLRPEPPVSHGE